MIGEIIASAIFILSLAGMGIIAYRKSSELSSYVPQQAEVSKIKVFPSARKTLINEVLLQKILCKIRILILKTDNKTSEWIKTLREKSKSNKAKFSEGYWDKLKK
ncbi:MAG: hypothetical protein A2365_01270 [Candidatus Nealsonbacteria bacterium RIFOXYB1_FULL_40_15]|uniref:Uncharacterized protein n=2 Tax=Candidatus Nealsoniibacteriota TaxID=1817911 RepID=A0A1G2ER72_9BACT|nr:MAG: hypothetical protein A2365_01270 [Candidatus Nealsonbacteria bacterium RIFOXYB1_FULL_40_15]OGZ27851.1 MAG: hypothetical protein A2427_04005 [Candidatus Nealsonbacteria bacterium RIFOXYC1_FULL_40_7]OGZ28011.1 MAG: hypothetical protein A2562_01350 [Candidatus Nealsonbacteria bacterium RIFOXYD1_FULL_39_11]